MAQAETATILVKKKDGTVVRMTMDEFRRYQESIKTIKQETIKATNPTSTAVRQGGQETDLPMQVGTEAVATSAPVKEIFVDEAMSQQSDLINQTPVSSPLQPKIRSPHQFGGQAKSKVLSQWSKKDHQSLLEEKVEEEAEDLVKLPPKRDDAADMIIRKLTFSLPGELLPRLKSLIISRLKDIRTDEQVMEYAVRPIDKGGLGLTQAHAGELVMRITPKHESTEAREHRSTPTPKHENNVMTQGVNEPSQPFIQPATIQPPPAPFEAQKPIMHDVLPPKEEKKNVGPVDELKMFSLVDFRRLSSKPEEAADILKEKFNVLKQESYALYLKALSAWQASPLYQQYQEVIRESLAKKIEIAALLSTAPTKENLRIEEFEAIAETGKFLTS